MKTKLILSLFLSLFLTCCSVSKTPTSANNTNIDQISISNEITVMWLNWDDSILEIDKGLSAGDIPSFNGATPSRQTDDKFSYRFDGWSPMVGPVYKDTCYKAVYISDRLYESITLSAQTLHIMVGDEYTYHYNFSPVNAYGKCELTTDNSNVVEVKEGGVIVGKNPGSATVRLTSDNGLVCYSSVYVYSIEYNDVPFTKKNQLWSFVEIEYRLNKVTFDTNSFRIDYSFLLYLPPNEDASALIANFYLHVSYRNAHLTNVYVAPDGVPVGTGVHMQEAYSLVTGSFYLNMNGQGGCIAIEIK